MNWLKPIKPIGPFLSTGKERPKVKQWTFNCKNGAYFIIRDWINFIQVITWNPDTNSYSNTNISRDRWHIFAEKLAMSL